MKTTNYVIKLSVASKHKRQRLIVQQNYVIGAVVDFQVGYSLTRKSVKALSGLCQHGSLHCRRDTF